MNKGIRLDCGAARTELVNTTICILRRILRERSGLSVTERGPAHGSTLRLELRPGIGSEGFAIEDGPGGQIRIAGNDERGLLYGVGRFLRDARYSAGRFTTGPWRGVSVPAKPIRGMYFATHFHNYYHVAPIRDVERYVEDLALWGCNALSVWFDMHHYRSLNDPEARQMIERLRAILRAANRVGMGAGLLFVANEAYQGSPAHLRVAPHKMSYGVELCPSLPEARALLMKWRREVLNAFRDIDVEHIWLWPYDQGGCACKACSPWGGNGYIRMSEIVARESKRVFPRAKIILSTWLFDYDGPGDYAGLWKVLARKPDWIDYLMVESRETFPSYVLEHGIPGGIPLVTFPEISMYRNMPWGGFGAHPLPTYLDGPWKQTRKLLAGSFPYSEGIYEDINKVIYLQYGWDASRPAMDTVREYAAYEFTPAAAGAVTGMVKHFDAARGHFTLRENILQQDVSRPWYRLTKVGATGRCLALAQQAAKQMPRWAARGWRWKLLDLRARIDAELTRSRGLPTARSERLFHEVARIYHARMQEADAVNPPTKAVLLAGQKQYLVPSRPRLSDCVATWQLSRLFERRAAVTDAPYVGLGHEASWSRYAKKGYPFVSVHERVGNADGLAYLANRFKVRKAGRWTIIMGYDGGIRVFVDGRPVFGDPQRINPATPERSRIPIELAAGRHEIVVALDTDAGRGWGIFFRFERPAKGTTRDFPLRIR